MLGSDRLDLVSPIFIDVEASAPVNGFPIEVGWAFVRAPGRVRTEAVLINPAGRNWLSTKVWAPRAAQLHGVSLADLAAHGTSTESVAALLNHEFRSGEVYSDSPEYDRAWIEMLYDEGLPCSFSVARKAAQTVVAELADGDQGR
jgi:hypothetical protein